MLKRIVFTGLLSSLLIIDVFGMHSEIEGKVLTPDGTYSCLSCSQNLYDELAPTLKIMKMFLKKKFLPLPGGLRDNVQAFFGSRKFTPPKNSMGDQYFELDDELTNILCELIEKEQHEMTKGYVTFWHGCTGDMLFMYKYYAHLFSRLMGDNLGEYVLRGDHLYARNPGGKTGLFNSIHELRDTYHVGEGDEVVGDYGQYINVSTLHANIALSVGPSTSRSTASSVGFMCNSFNAKKEKLIDIISTTLLLQGMSLAEANAGANQVQELFQKYFPDSSKNGGILGISYPKEIADQKLALHVQAGGAAYDPSIQDLLEKIEEISGSKINDPQLIMNQLLHHQSIDGLVSTVIYLLTESNLVDKKDELKEIFEDYFSKSQGNSSIEYLLDLLKVSEEKDLSKFQICNLTNEIALYLHPYVRPRIFGTFRHPLSEQQQKNLESDLEKLVDSHVKLITKHKSIEGAFIMAGGRSEEYKPSASAIYCVDVLPLLISRGMLSEAKEVIKDFPNFLENEKIVHSLIGQTLLSAINENYLKILEDIKELTGKPLFQLMDNPQEMAIIVNRCLLNRGYIDYIDLSEFWQVANFDDSTVFSILKRNYLPISQAKIDPLKTFIEKNKSRPEILEELLFESDELIVNYDGVVKNLMENGFSLNPYTEIGKKRFDRIINQLRPEQLAQIIDFYKLNPNDHREMYVGLVSLGTNFYGNIGYCRMCSDGYEIKNYESAISLLPTKILFEELRPIPSIRIGYGAYSDDKLEDIANLLSIKFARPYPTSMVEPYLKFQASMHHGSYLVDTKIPEHHSWLDSFHKTQNLNEINELVHELDNLDILFANLKLLDDHPVIKSIAKTNGENTEEFVNDWFCNQISDSAKFVSEIYSLIDQINGHEISEEENFKNLYELLKKSPLFVASAHVQYLQNFDLKLHTLKRTWKFDLNKFGICFYGDDDEVQKLTALVEEEVRQNANWINCKNFVSSMISYDCIPESIVRNKEILTKILDSFDNKDRVKALEYMLFSKNKSVQQFALAYGKQVFYPHTNIKVSELPQIMKKYEID